MSLTAPERETIITFNDEDGGAHVWTAQRPIITKLRKNPSATLLVEGNHDGSVWAEFEIPASLVSFRKQRKPLTEEQHTKKAEILANARLGQTPQTAATVENA